MSSMNDNEILQALLEMPDEELSKLQFSMPWSINIGESTYQETTDTSHAKRSKTHKELQDECWLKFNRTPQVNTSVRGLTGRLTGWGFEITSGEQIIQEAIDEITYDARNRLYDFWYKFVGRAFIEGELFLLLTCHDDGFVEIDFIDPTDISSGGTDNTGIIFHPNKKLFPLFYLIDQGVGLKKELIPSINIARFPELVSVAAEHKDYKIRSNSVAGSKSRKKVYKKFGGFKRFVLCWDKSFITRRAVSYLRTTLEWLNHYENLKKYEIDHKKSSGAYLWVVKIVDGKALKDWLSMTEEQRKSTGIMAKKTPGSMLILPPGMELDCVNPKLASITEQDNDILDMISSGLNEESGVMTGRSVGTFASIKASRGPMSDRVSDEMALFDRFLKFDFWASIFFLKNRLINFPELFKVKEAVSFNAKNGEPVMKNIQRRPEFLIDVTYPVSATIDTESLAKGLLGVKHGPVSENLGIPRAEVAKKLGFGGYARHRLRKATEDETFPELIYSVDQEAAQEKAEGEPSKKGNKEDKKGEDK